MSAQMVAQISGAHKRLPAHRTFKGSRIVMVKHMLSHLVGCRQFFVAAFQVATVDVMLRVMRLSMFQVG